MMKSYPKVSGLIHLLYEDFYTFSFIFVHLVLAIANTVSEVTRVHIRQSIYI